MYNLIEKVSMDLLKCGHKHTEIVSMEAAHNPEESTDVETCLVCGAQYNTLDNKWEQL